MDCDAKKKCIIKDIDGTFLGSVGTVLPQSEVPNSLLEKNLDACARDE